MYFHVRQKRNKRHCVVNTRGSNTLMFERQIRVTKQDAHSRIERQIQKGKALYEEGADILAKPSSSAHLSRLRDSFKVKYEQWESLTAEVLNELFVSGRYSHEFKEHRSSEDELVSSDWVPDIDYYLRKELLPKIDFLKVLGGNVDDFDQVDDQRQTGEGRQSKETKEKQGSPNKIFIGHGNSKVWTDLKDFLQNRLHLQWDEFNRESAAGFATTERLGQMLKGAIFAFIVMTAEDEHSDNSLHARENAIHEAGLFQGRLGFPKAIILLEEGCSEFSNIKGLTQIRFPKGQIDAKFEDVRKVLEREKLI
jgi:predicted nucleotide-binding protein